MSKKKEVHAKHTKRRTCVVCGWKTKRALRRRHCIKCGAPMRRRPEPWPTTLQQWVYRGYPSEAVAAGTNLSRNTVKNLQSGPFNTFGYKVKGMTVSRQHLDELADFFHTSRKTIVEALTQSWRLTALRLGCRPPLTNRRQIAKAIANVRRTKLVEAEAPAPLAVDWYIRDEMGKFAKTA